MHFAAEPRRQVRQRTQYFLYAQRACGVNLLEPSLATE